MSTFTRYPTPRSDSIWADDAGTALVRPDGSTVTIGGAAVPAPNAVTGLTLTSVTESAALFTWQASSSGATYYDLRYSVTGAGVWTTGSYLSASGSITGLLSATGYDVQVRAGNAYGVSAWSATVQATTLAPIAPPVGYPTTFDYYLSPSGADSNNGTTSATPWKTFAKVTASMPTGKRLGLLNGTYSVAAGTGCINFNTANSGVPVSGTAGNFSEICAVNPGGAIVSGVGEYLGAAVFLGRSTRKDSYIKIRGIKAIGDVFLYNTTRCYIKDVGVNGALLCGTNDTSAGATLTNTYNLIEDCWAWAGSGYRVLMANYQAHNNIWRRIVLRKDGGGPTGSGNPNIVTTTYNSKEVRQQNIISIDRILGGEQPYADFATAQHNNGAADQASFRLGGNKWQGVMCINSTDLAFTFEADDVEAGLVTWDLENCVAYPGGFNNNSVTGGISASQGKTQVRNFTSLSANVDAFRVRDIPLTSYVRDSIARGSAGSGVNFNGGATMSYIDRFGNALADNGTVTNGLSFDPLAGSPKSLLYLTRIETGSAAKGAGTAGADVGANVLFQYGAEGSFYGDANFETLTGTSLWPWPNEARIKSDMAASSTRGFCSSGLQLDGVNQITLTSYIWERLGNQMPSSVYPSVAVPANTVAPALTGAFVNGGTVSLSNGTWTNVPTGYTRQYTRNGTPIGGATGTSYVCQGADVGTTLAATVVATNAVGSSSAVAATGSATVVAATAPANTVAPSITGTLTVGSTLTAVPGTWTGNPAPTYTYVWKLAGTPISGATDPTYIPTATGSHTVTVTGTNVAGNANATSAGVTVNNPAAPANTVAPAITSATPNLGDIVSCSTGTWTGVGLSYGYVWKRAGTPIGGATGSTYAIVLADVSVAITCTVTATDVVSQATSATTASVTPTNLTIVGDTLVDTPGVNLASHTATGPKGGGTWSKLWNNGAGEIVIVAGGDGLKSTSTSNQRFFAHSATPASASQDIQAPINLFSAARVSLWVGGRLTSGGDGYVAGYLAGTWAIYKFAAGTYSSLGTYADTVTGVKTAKLELRTNSQKLYIDGVLRISATDSAITATGKMGVCSLASDTADGDYMDDWQGTS